MSEQRQGRPGFHAIMMAAAYAEEGLAGHAREILREDAAEPREARPGEPSGLRAWLRGGVRRPADRTA